MLTIGNVAKRVGVRPSAIRFYETKGIVRPVARGQNGYRIYGNDAIKLLLFVRRAQSLGITLREIKPLVELATQGQQPCNHVKQLARSHLQEINQKISALQTLRHELRALLRRKAGRPHDNEVCRIIERRS
jgi:DNA-binding transcriptional MerR regulator